MCGSVRRSDETDRNRARRRVLVHGGLHLEHRLDKFRIQNFLRRPGGNDFPPDITASLSQ